MRWFVRTISSCVVATLAVVAQAPAASAAPLGPVPIEGTPSGATGAETSVSTRPSGLRSTATEGIETSHRTIPIAPGLDLSEFDRFEPDGWIRGDVLAADLSKSGVRPKYLSPETLTDPAPLTEQAARADAVAGVNGDFFDIGESGAPLGVGMDQGRLLHAPADDHNTVASVDADQRLGSIMNVVLQGQLRQDDGATIPLSELNTPQLSADGIGLFTSFWGGASRKSAVEGARAVREVEITDGAVSAVREEPADGPVPRDAVRVLGRDAGADALHGLNVGDRLSVEYGPRDDQLTDVAVGGNKVLLRDGEVEPVDDSELHPRTAVGFSADGRRMWLLTVDGRQAESRGMTERELAEHLRELGAANAINFDGGGSSTLVAREQGESAATVRNSPSDGEERPVPNGFGFTAQQGSGWLAGFRVSPEVPESRAERVFPGLTRRLAAHGHDETGAPVAAHPTWRVHSPASGRVDDADGRPVFRAKRPGVARVVASDRGAHGRADLRVLDPATRLDIAPGRLSLSTDSDRQPFQVRGFDRNGFSTWIEPSDVTLDYDSRKVEVVAERDGFVVKPRVPEAATAVTARVGDLVTRLPVSVGAHDQRISGMDEVAEWRASVFPDSVGGTLAGAQGRSGGRGVALDYALTGSTVTRAAYVDAAKPLPLPAGTQKLGAWVHGDGRGAWLRFTVTDSSGVSTTVDWARHVDWTGWRYVEAAVPPGVSAPSALSRIYVVEPDGDRQYEGRVVFDDLTASVAPDVPVPPAPVVRDSTVTEGGSLPPDTGRSSRVAVVSDVQFTADEPDGPQVYRARRALREARAAHPDMVVINGDFVDRGMPEDFTLARTLIDEELTGRVPWRYVPGNHETYGPGDLRAFRAEFGATRGVLDSDGTRFVFLDSSLGSLRAGGFDQITMLREALDGAARDPRVRAVAVFAHHPTDDPTPAQASELSDAKEAALLESWLSEFESSSRKPAVSVAAHAGTFHSSTVDGVPFLVNGNAGKSPSTAPERGGFTGWSLLDVDAGNAEQPVRWQPRPYVDGLALRAPETLPVGATERVGAEVQQDGRMVPVGYPIGADWRGSANVHIGSPEDAEDSDIAAFDPVAERFVALRPGTVELSVRVNGVQRGTHIRITP